MCGNTSLMEVFSLGDGKRRRNPLRPVMESFLKYMYGQLRS